MTNKRSVYSIMALITIVMLLLYFFQFHEGLSQSQSDWGDFASFIAGILSPTLALMNIIVFIDLTKSIERNRLIADESKETEIKKRHYDEIEHQKLMALFNLRVQTIQNLDLTLERTFLPTINECRIGAPVTLVETISVLESFLRNKMDIFDFHSKEEKETFTQEIINGHKLISEIGHKMADIEYKVNNRDINSFLDFKAELIRNFYAVILERDIKWNKKPR